jgi:hypothetical protein
VIPAHTEDITEWECEPVLKTSNAAQPETEAA